MKDHSMSYIMYPSENLTGRLTSTIELCESGLRSATTRSYPLGKIGELITFNNRPQIYRITNVELLTSDNTTDIKWIAKWSLKEQWTMDHFKKVLGGKTVHIGSWQTTFERVMEPKQHTLL